MQIKKNGWLYRVAYGLRDEHERPIKVNLCPFFWKFIWMLFIGWIFICAVYYIIEGVVYFFGFFFAYRSTTEAEWKLTKKVIIPYERWPTTKSGKRILPIWFVLAGLIVWVMYEKSRATAIATVKIVSTLLFWKWVGGIVCCIALILLVAGFFTSETWQLFKAWYRAKKEKVCPVIEIVD